MCAPCNGADEAHYKRHVEICEKLRPVYEINGIDSSSALANGAPHDQRDDRRDQNSARPPDEDDGRSIFDSMAFTKKQRKEAKRLEKAVTRPKVITQAEVENIGSIIHLSSHGVGSMDPANMDEVEEIEKYLRYHANVYNMGVKRQTLKRFGSIQDADVDFEKEMERILNHLGITELLKHNTRNRGLKGKDLKTFETSVAELKVLIVEDLVLVKRDEMEMRMRRAGYLRYANRTSFNILEDRYTDKDWRTGERIISPLSEPLQMKNTIEDEAKFYEKENSPPWANNTGDYRHLTQGHRRFGSPTKIERPVLVGFDPLSMKPQQQTQLNLVGTRLAFNGISDLISSTPLSIVPSGSPVSSQKTNVKFTHLAQHVSMLDTERPDLVEQTMKESTKQSTEKIAGHPPIQASPHPLVSQKKAAKKAREAKRKAKKHTVQKIKAEMRDEDTDFDKVDPRGANHDQVNESDASACKSPHLMLTVNSISNMHVNKGPIHMIPPDEYSLSITVSKDRPPFPCPLLTSPTSSGPFPSPSPRTTTIGKEIDWKKYMREFTVDALTSPSLSDPYNWIQMKTSKCGFESLSIPDCPFHTPYFTFNLSIDQCYIVFPSYRTQSVGPYNRLRAEKLFPILNSRQGMKNKLAIIDLDLYPWVTRSRAAHPHRLTLEYHRYRNGQKAGRLMHQELAYYELWHQNRHLPQISTADLEKGRKEAEPEGTERVCYCMDLVPEKIDMVEFVACSFKRCTIRLFHKRCLRNQGFDMLTKWYCTYCQGEMASLAEQLINELKE